MPATTAHNHIYTIDICTLKLGLEIALKVNQLRGNIFTTRDHSFWGHIGNIFPVATWRFGVGRRRGGVGYASGGYNSCGQASNFSQLQSRN